jgi:uncharacterized protein GlcG (DUF336 family)
MAGGLAGHFGEEARNNGAEPSPAIISQPVYDPQLASKTNVKHFEYHPRRVLVMPNITLDQAEAVLAGAKAAALDLGKAFSFSVVDARGDLITMCKMDGSAWRTPYVSRGKARASACFGEPSGDLTERSTTPIMRAVMEVERGEFVPGQGALPIYMNGELIGAVGGSGGTAQEDEDCSRAGIGRLAGASASR